jgi:hypothetical protein
VIGGFLTAEIAENGRRGRRAAHAQVPERFHHRQGNIFVLISPFLKFLPEWTRLVWKKIHWAGLSRNVSRLRRGVRAGSHQKYIEDQCERNLGAGQ